MRLPRVLCGLSRATHTGQAHYFAKCLWVLKSEDGHCNLNYKVLQCGGLPLSGLVRFAVVCPPS